MNKKFLWFKNILVKAFRIATLKPNSKENGLFFKESKNGDKFFKDKKGNIHKLSKETQELWLKTFNLKSLDEDFIPNFTPEVKVVLSEVLKDKPLKLNKNDFEKLVKKGRIKYISKIKEALENPQIIFKDESGDLIFAREIKNKLFLINVSREYKEEFLSVSISPKKENTIKNRLEKAQNIILDKLGLKLRESSAHKAFTGVLSSTNSPNLKVNSTTNQLKNQEKPSKLDEAMEELEKARKVAKANEALEILEKTKAELMPTKINIDEFLNTLDEIKNKKNFLEHILEKKDASQRLAYLNLIEPTLKSPNIKITKTENRILKEKRFKKFTDGKDFFYLLVTKENGNLILTGFKTNKLNTIKKELADFDSLEYGADIIHTFIQQGSKQDTQGVGYQVPNSTTNQLKNQEKPSKLDEAMEELEKIRVENHKERNLSESQNPTQVNAKDSSALDEFRKESQEKAEQKEIQQQNDDDTIRRQK